MRPTRPSATAAYLSAFGEAYRSPVPLVGDENSPPKNPFADILANVRPLTPPPG